MKKSLKIPAVFVCLVLALCSVSAAFTLSSAVPAPLTYRVTLFDNADGTVTVIACVPAGTASGKIVVTPGPDLTYIEGSLKSDVLKLSPDAETSALVAKNENYDADGVQGQCISFAGPISKDKEDNTIPEGTVAMTASYTVAEGAEPDAGDVSFELWNLSDGDVSIATQDDGDVDLTFLPARTVVFKDWDGRELKTMKVRHGSAATAPENPDTKPNCHFTAWDRAFDSITEDTVVNALYAADTFTVTFTAGEHGSLEGECSATVDYGTPVASIAKPTPLADDCCIFYKWSEAPETVTSDIEITASFLLLGDVNLDNNADNLDASKVLQYDAGLLPFSELQQLAGDVNRDGKVDNLDASVILQYDAGLIAGF